MITGIFISPRKVAGTMMVIVLGLVVLSLAGQYFKDFFGDSELAQKAISKLNLDEERNNLPTWYQSSTLLISSVVLLVIGMARRRLKDSDAKYWWLLSLIFLFLSVDEAVSIHEQMTMPLRTAFELEGFLFLSWVIPAIAILILLGGVFAGFLMRLPVRTRYLMIGSGIIFLIGAIGLEMVGANYMFLAGDPPDIGSDFGYALITSAEEFFEMAGIALFVYTLLTYLFEPAPQSDEKRSIAKTVRREATAWSIS